MKKIVNAVKSLAGETAALAWTLGGTGLVLITLSGDTLRWGIWISVASLALHFIGVLTGNSENDD